jgi:hypothetical protein
VRPPLVLEMERPAAVAFPLAPNRMPKEPFVLTDMPAVLSAPNRPLAVVSLLGFDVCRQVLAQHVGFHEAVGARRQETDRDGQA